MTIPYPSRSQLTFATRSLPPVIISIAMAQKHSDVQKRRPWIADEEQLAVARRMLPHLTEIMGTLWRDFEVAGCHHPSRPFTSPNTSEDCQKISVYFEHHAKGPEGNIILRSPYHYPPDASLPGFVRVPLGWEDLCEPCAEFGEVWEPIDPGDVTVATIVFANIG